MANEIDLYKDLDRAEQLIEHAKMNDETLMLKAWLKEKKRIVKEIKENYPDLNLSN